NTSWEEVQFDPAKPTQDEIKKRAFEIFVESGRIAGRDVDNWLKAEAELVEKKRLEHAKAAEAEASLCHDITFNKDAERLIDRVPDEWKRIVKSFQLRGANEAVIAGGALRDLFNDREIKDVDIFLRSQGNQKRNRRLIAEVFDAAGVEIQEQKVG